MTCDLLFHSPSWPPTFHVPHLNESSIASRGALAQVDWTRRKSTDIRRQRTFQDWVERCRKSTFVSKSSATRTGSQEPSIARESNRHAIQEWLWKNQVTWLSAAFSGFQLSELLGTVIACHCMSLQSCTCQPNVCGYCSNESGRQYRQYLTCCTGSVPVLDDEMHMGSEFGGDTNGSLVNWGNHNARSHAAKLWQHPKLKESSEI